MLPLTAMPHSLRQAIDPPPSVPPVRDPDAAAAVPVSPPRWQRLRALATWLVQRPSPHREPKGEPERRPAAIRLPRR